MPRKARDERLDTRTARLRLPVRSEPYWRTIQEGRAIGYRRVGSGKAGMWIARHYTPADGRRYQSIGPADDMLAADGAGTLSFAQAQARAGEWFGQIERDAGRVVERVTVRHAIDAYLADYRARGGKAERDLRTTISAHILPDLGDREVCALTYSIVRKWHHQIAAAPARLRTAPTAKQANIRQTEDTDAHRARRSSANRILTVLKAALSLAYREGRVPTDDAWRRVKPFQSVDAPKVRYLTDGEAGRLVNACPPDLRTLVTAALLTGCRFGELAALRPADVDLDAGVLTIPASKGGSARVVVLTAEAQGFFRGTMLGKARTALLFDHDEVVGQATKTAPAVTRRSAWGKSHQSRPLRIACEAASISPAISFHILRHTHASRLAMKGVPMGVIAAQLGHSDVKMTAKHYAHLSPGYVADTIRAAFGNLGLVPETNVVALPSAG